MTISTDAYLAHLRADAALLAAAARATPLDKPVPTCPEWDVRALVEHVGSVYHHKLACMRLGRRPGEDEYASKPPGDLDVVTWMERALDELVGELLARGPAAPSYTWHPADQTVGFWVRRMAQETVVHRVDGELAAGAVSPVADDIAVDGIDEILAVFLGGPWWVEEPVESATGRTVAVASAGETWRVTLEPTAVPVTRGGDGEVAATISGAPFDALMWTWGREPFGPVTVDGDETAVAELRARLALVSD